MHVPAPGIPASPDPSTERLQERGDPEMFPDHFTLVTGTSSDPWEEWARGTCLSASAWFPGLRAGWVAFVTCESTLHLCSPENMNACNSATHTKSTGKNF